MHCIHIHTYTHTHIYIYIYIYTWCPITIAQSVHLSYSIGSEQSSQTHGQAKRQAKLFVDFWHIRTFSASKILEIATPGLQHQFVWFTKVSFLAFLFRQLASLCLRNVCFHYFKISFSEYDSTQFLMHSALILPG